MNERPMTEDTARAIEIIAPMAKELNIRVSADDNYLFCNGQAIGIYCNSTYATIKEFIGYVFLRVWAKDYFQMVGGALLRRIKRYWYTNEQLEQFQKMREREGKGRELAKAPEDDGRPDP